MNDAKAQAAWHPYRNAWEAAVSYTHLTLPTKA
mgnify:CR=1 FL=1